MVVVFSETTTVLSRDFVSSFSSEKLAVALFCVGEDTGIACSVSENTFTFSGDWGKILKACSILEKYFVNEVDNTVDSKIQLQCPSSSVDGCAPKGDIERINAVSDRKTEVNSGIAVPLCEAGVEVNNVLQADTEEEPNGYYENVKLGVEGCTESIEPVVQIHQNNENRGDGFRSNEFNETTQNEEMEMVSDETKAFDKMDNLISDDIKPDFDYSVMDVDTDIDEEFCNSTDKILPETVSVINTETDMKIQIEINGKTSDEMEMNAPISSKGFDRTEWIKQEIASLGKKKIRVHKERKRKKRTKLSVPLKCEQCDYVAKHKNYLRNHIIRKHVKKEHVCPHCKKEFGIRGDMNRHILEAHSGSHYCKECDKYYKSKKVFDQHMLTHEDGYVKPVYECDKCTESFEHAGALDRHVKSKHLGIEIYKTCKICERKFVNEKTLTMHVNGQHRGIKAFSCDICGKSFASDRSMMEHRYEHIAGKRLSCTKCSKLFRHKATLEKHMNTVHKYSYYCSMCGKEFTIKSALKVHEQRHLGIRPHPCNYCSRSFNDSASKVRHVFMKHQIEVLQSGESQPADEMIKSQTGEVPKEILSSANGKLDNPKGEEPTDKQAQPVAIQGVQKGRN